MKITALWLTSLISALIPLEILGMTNLLPGDSQNYHHSLAIGAMRKKKRPFYRKSGIKRGICPKTSAQASSGELMMFLPEAIPDRTSVRQPTFYFYIPDKAEDLGDLELRMNYPGDAKSDDGAIPVVKLPKPKTPGILQVQLPQPLEQGRRYTWHLSLKCKHDQDTVANFDGIVVYKVPDRQVTNQLAQATSTQQKAEIYRQADLWLDAVGLFMEDPSFKTQSLDQMLATIELEKPPEPPPQIKAKVK